MAFEFDIAVGILAEVAHDQRHGEQVLRLLLRRGFPNHQNADFRVETPEPTELERIVGNGLASAQNLERDVALHRPDGEAILRGDVVERVGRRETAGCPHVFDDDIRLTRDKAAQMPRYRPRIGVIAAAGIGAHQQRDALPAIEIGDRIGGTSVARRHDRKAGCCKKCDVMAQEPHERCPNRVCFPILLS